MAATKNDRKYMEMAVAEMLESRSEHEQKHDPLVGAVLVNRAGQFLAKAHRGALRVGDHAEFTLIERKLGDRSLEGSTLYVTLEPCTKREPPKIACAERVASARLHRVFIGMLDPNPAIQGHGVTFLQRRGVEVDFFDLDLVHQIRKENEAFIEQYELAEETSRPEEEREGPSDKEKEAVPAASLDDLSAVVIADYLAARGEKLVVPSPELWAFFHKNGLVAYDKGRKTFVPTAAGLLLFGIRPEDFFVQSKVKVEVQQAGKIRTEDVGGPLLALPDRIKDFLEAYGPRHTVIDEFKRVERPDYPWEAVREALINAIAHRDYREGARVLVQVLPNRFVVKSPGLPLKPLSLAKIRSYNAPPYSRNPRIADSFCHLKWMEERGWGLGRMRDHLVSHGLPPPQFNFESGYFVVTFAGRGAAPREIQIPTELLAKLDERQRTIM